MGDGRPEFPLVLDHPPHLPVVLRQLLPHPIKLPAELSHLIPVFIVELKVSGHSPQSARMPLSAPGSASSACSGKTEDRQTASRHGKHQHGISLKKIAQLRYVVIPLAHLISIWTGNLHPESLVFHFLRFKVLPLIRVFPPDPSCILSAARRSEPQGRNCIPEQRTYIE